MKIGRLLFLSLLLAFLVSWVSPLNRGNCFHCGDDSLWFDLCQALFQRATASKVNLKPTSFLQ